MLTIVRTSVSQDTVRALEYLLQEARAGRVIGLAWVAMQQGLRYSGDLSGEIKRYPTFGRGMVARLDDELSDIIGPDRA